MQSWLAIGKRGPRPPPAGARSSTDLVIYTTTGEEAFHLMPFTRNQIFSLKFKQPPVSTKAVLIPIARMQLLKELDRAWTVAVVLVACTHTLWVESSLRGPAADATHTLFHAPGYRRAIVVENDAAVHARVGVNRHG